jgi:hypothetical protein
MLFIPYESYEMTSTGSPEQVMARLSAETETDLSLFQTWNPFFYRGGKSFKGTIGPQSFAIFRLSRNKYALAPKIEGDVILQDAGSKIRMTISDKSTIWVIIVFALLYWTPWEKLHQRSIQDVFESLIVIYVFFIAFFNVEVNRAKKLLEKIIP